MTFPFAVQIRYWRRALFLLVALVFYSLTPVTQAQVTPDAGALQQELQRQIERSGVSEPEFPAMKPAESAPDLKGEQKFLVKTFAIQGNTLIPTDELLELIAPWMGRMLTVSEIRQATTAIAERYASDGRIASVFLPIQDIVNNTVTIQIVEGRVGNVIITPDNQSDPIRFPPDSIEKFLKHGNISGDFIESDNLERSLILVNEIPGLSIAASLESGQREGTIDIKGVTKARPIFNGRLEASNYGSGSTGVGQALGNITLNSAFGIGDLIAADLIESLGSTYTAGSASLPVGYSGWRAGLSVSHLQYRTLSDWSPTPTQGSSDTVGLNTTYALQRSARSNANVNFSIDSRRYLNKVDAGTISDYSILSLTAGVSGNVRLGTNGYLTWGSGLVIGNLTINDSAQALSDAAGPLVAGSYGKLTMNASANLPFTDPSTAFVATAYGQLANKNLNTAEQIYLGGPYGIRAYPVAQGGGAQGAILNFELRHHFAPGWTISAFSDVGVVQQYVNPYSDWQGLTNADNVYTLADAGLSLKWSDSNFDVTGAVAFRVGGNPLYNSAGQQLNSDNNYHAVQGWIRAAWYF